MERYYCSSSKNRFIAVHQVILGRKTPQERRKFLDIVFLLKRFAHAEDLISAEVNIFLVDFHADFAARSNRWLKKVFIVLVLVVFVERMINVERVVLINLRLLTVNVDVLVVEVDLKVT